LLPPSLEQVFIILRHSFIAIKTATKAGRQWFIPILLATQETEIRRPSVPSQARQIVLETPISKIPNTKRAGGVAQDVSPEFKPQYRKTNKTKKKKPCY
jgi:hypothetical protein